MKKSLLHVLLSFLCLPTALKAQTDTIEFVSIYVTSDPCMTQNDWMSCPYTIVDANFNFISTTSFLSPDGIGITFPFESSVEPYHLILDENCLENNSVYIDNHFFEISQATSSGYSTTEVNNELHYYHNYAFNICNSGGGQEPFRLFTLDVDYINCGEALAGCPATLFEDGVEKGSATGISGVFFGGHIYNINSSYTLSFDAACVESEGVQLSQYTYQIYPQYTHGDAFALYYFQSLIIECESINDTIIDIDSCGNFHASVQPYIGYYQNTTNHVSFSWGSTFSTDENVIITIDVPQGVTLNGSWSGNTYSQAGNQLILNTTIQANTNFYDILVFNVPGGINDGVLHTYSITISSIDTLECNYVDNIDHLDMIVGNSYDPNDKTVNQPEIISPEIQDDFTYTIRFQNTGTAPAQNIYIIDTLSQNLDWSTFVVLESSHPVIVSDLGNGVKRFSYDGIWLPDSNSNLAQSQGFVSYKITEKATNGEGTEIFNTAYIYFDHNPAIVTNTTYNINTSEELGLQNLTENKIVLFPNPASSMIEVQSDVVIDKIEIVDVTGKLCLSNTSPGTSQKIYINNFDSGIYFIKIKTGNEESALRFIKQ